MTTDAGPDPILGYQRGDRFAFQQLVDRYATRLSVFFYRHTWDREQAEDLAQDVFLKIVRGVDRYQPQGCPDTFVWRIARNVLIDHVRSQQTRPKTTSMDAKDEDPEAPVSPEPAAKETGPLDTLTRLESLERLRRALAQLSLEQRLVFEMGVLEGLPYAEISSVLEIPVGTVKSRIFNAVRTLRRLLPDLVRMGRKEDSETRPPFRGNGLGRAWRSFFGLSRAKKTNSPLGTLRVGTLRVGPLRAEMARLAGGS